MCLVSHHYLSPLPCMDPHLTQAVTFYSGPPAHMGQATLLEPNPHTELPPVWKLLSHMDSDSLHPVYLCREVLLSLLVLWHWPGGFRTKLFRVGRDQDNKHTALDHVGITLYRVLIMAAWLPKESLWIWQSWSLENQPHLCFSHQMTLTLE